MYQPAFLETFVVLMVILVWTRALQGRSPSWTWLVPWAAGAGVVGAQAMALWILVRQGNVESGLLYYARWGGMWVGLAALAVLGVLTVLSFFRKPSA